jgi:hypothetical protein
MYKKKYLYGIFTLQEAIFLASYSGGRQKWQCEQRKPHIYGVNGDERKEGEEEEEEEEKILNGPKFFCFKGGIRMDCSLI